VKTRMISRALWVYLLVNGIFIAGIIGVLLVVVVSPRVEELSYLSRLGREGTVSGAVILNKGVRDALTSPTDGYLRSDLWVRVQFDGPKSIPIQRIFGVTLPFYNSHSPGDTLRVAYLIDTPGRYQIWSSADDNEANKSQTRKRLAAYLISVAVLVFSLCILAVHLVKSWKSTGRGLV